MANARISLILEMAADGSAARCHRTFVRCRYKNGPIHASRDNGGQPVCPAPRLLSLSKTRSAAVQRFQPGPVQLGQTQSRPVKASQTCGRRGGGMLSDGVNHLNQWNLDLILTPFNVTHHHSSPFPLKFLTTLVPPRHLTTKQIVIRRLQAYAIANSTPASHPPASAAAGPPAVSPGAGRALRRPPPPHSGN